MAGLAQTGMQKILDTLTGKAAFTMPSLQGVLTTTTPTASTAGTEITTGQYGGYARQALTGASWSGGASGASTYNALLDWGAASASTGTNILGFEIWDITSGVRMWWEGVASIPVVAGTHVSYASGQLVATIPILSGGIGFATTYANKMVDHMTGKTTFGAAPSMFLALCSTACTATTIGTELVYTGYGTRPSLPTASCNAATLVSTNIDVVTNAAVNFPADTAGTQTAGTNFAVMDAATVGNLIAGGTVTNCAVAIGLTPDFPSGSTILRLN